MNSQVVVKLSISEVPSKIYIKRVKTLKEATYLDNSLLSLDFKDLSLSHGSVSKSDINDFCILGELDIV